MSRRMLIVLLLVFAILTGCKAAPVEPTEAKDAMVETAYPIDEGYPLEDVVIYSGEEAYPVKQADLEHLYRRWTMTTYLVDSNEEATPTVTLTFREDGTFSRESEKGLTEGTWRAEISLMSNLVLESDGQEMQAYHLQTLTESELRWQILQDSTMIEEVYSPAD